MRTESERDPNAVRTHSERNASQSQTLEEQSIGPPNVSEGGSPYSAKTREAVRTLIDLKIERGFGLDGALFLLDQDNTVEPLWGTAEACIWSAGEPMYVFSSPNVGKTTLVQGLLLARAGIRAPRFLDWPVAVDERKVLYIAADRPRQAARSMRRMVSEADRETLETKLIVWPEGLPFTLPTQPEGLLPWVRSFGGVGTVVIDSLFNVAPSLTDEEGAANTNNALQTLVRAGIDVIALHHDRKRNENDRKRITQDDMYGGRPISGGAGSIVYLDGEPNTGKFSMRLVKAPAGPVVPVDLHVNFRRGSVDVK